MLWTMVEKNSEHFFKSMPHHFQTKFKLMKTKNMLKILYQELYAIIKLILFIYLPLIK